MKNIFAKAATFLMSRKKLNQALIRSAQNGDNAEVKKYLEAGADIHYHDDAAVGQAAMYGHLETLKFLKEKGANLRAKSGYALSVAATEGQPHVVRYLLEQGIPAVAVAPEAWALINARTAAAQGLHKKIYEEVVLLLQRPNMPVKPDAP